MFVDLKDLRFCVETRKLWEPPHPSSSDIKSQTRYWGGVIKKKRAGAGRKGRKGGWGEWGRSVMCGGSRVLSS
jgi:hypothetical protein